MSWRPFACRNSSKRFINWNSKSLCSNNPLRPPCMCMTLHMELLSFSRFQPLWSLACLFRPQTWHLPADLRRITGHPRALCLLQTTPQQRFHKVLTPATSIRMREARTGTTSSDKLVGLRSLSSTLERRSSFLGSSSPLLYIHPSSHSAPHFALS